MGSGLVVERQTPDRAVGDTILTQVATLTNHKRCTCIPQVSKGISQNILSQIFDVVQSDVTL